MLIFTEVFEDSHWPRTRKNGLFVLFLDGISFNILFFNVDRIILRPVSDIRSYTTYWKVMYLEIL